MMVPMPVLIGLIAAIVVLAALLMRRGGGRSQDLTAPPQDLSARIAPAGLPPGLVGEVREFLSRRAKIDAIKHVREVTGLGLFEAKTLVEAIERGEPADD